MTVLNLCLIVVRIPSHVFVVSLLSCIMIWGYSTARNSQLEHSRATVMHGRVSLNSSNSRGDTEAGGTRLLCTSWNKVTECEYQDWGQAFCCV